MIEPEFSERGFAWWPTLKTAYGHEMDVAESSSAEGPHIWLYSRGKCHLDTAPHPHPGVPAGIAEGYAAAHMTLEQAMELRDRLDSAIAFVRDRWQD